MGMNTPFAEPANGPCAARGARAQRKTAFWGVRHGASAEAPWNRRSEERFEGRDDGSRCCCAHREVLEIPEPFEVSAA